MSAEGANESRIFCDQRTQVLNIAFDTSFEKVRDVFLLPFFDFHLQSAPTGKAVIASDG